MEPLNSGHPWGTTFGRYIGVAFIGGGGLFCTQTVLWDLGPDRYIAAELFFSGVTVKEGFVSTIISNFCSSTDST